MGRESDYMRGGPKPLAPGDVSLKSIGAALCSADLKRNRGVVTLVFDDLRSRDQFWDLAHKLRAESQRS